MQTVPSIPPPIVDTTKREVNAAHRVDAVQQVHPSPFAELLLQQQEQAARHYEPPASPAPPAEDRRKYCRRTRHLPVLVELRSGLERRRHDLFADSPHEHVDELA